MSRSPKLCDLRPSSLFHFLAHPCRPRSFPHRRTGPSSLSPPLVPTQHAPSDRQLLWINPPSLRLATKSPFTSAPRTPGLVSYSTSSSVTTLASLRLTVRPRREAEPITAGLHPRTRPWQTLDKRGRGESQVSFGKSLVSSSHPTRPALWRQYSPPRPCPSRNIFPTETKRSTSGRSAAAALLLRPVRPLQRLCRSGSEEGSRLPPYTQCFAGICRVCWPAGEQELRSPLRWERRRGSSGRTGSWVWVFAASLSLLALNETSCFVQCEEK